MQIRQLLDIWDILTALENTKLKGKLPKRLSRVINHGRSALKRYENQRIELVKSHSPKDENGKDILDERGSIHVAPDQMEAFKTAHEALLDTEFVIDQPIHPSHIDEQIVDLSAADYTALEAISSETAIP